MKTMKNNFQGLKTAILEISNLNVTTVEGRILFKDLNMSLANDRVALIGRNGVGKSTLLKVILGKIEPVRGKIIVDSEPYFVPQSLSRDPDSEDMNTTFSWYKETKISQKVLANEFAATGLRRLSELFHEKTLSHGELRKLKLLIGKLTKPELLLLDEPTEDLDDYGISWLKTWLKNWPGGLVVASHHSGFLSDIGIEKYLELR